MNKKKPNPTDSTRRNVQAANKKIAVHNTRLKDLERRMKLVEKAMNQTVAYISEMRLTKVVGDEGPRLN